MKHRSELCSFVGLLFPFFHVGVIFSSTSSTNTLGTQNHFNDMLGNKDLKFTYLVPSHEAWTNLQGKMASTWKVLFHGDFGYQVKHLNDLYHYIMD